MFPLRPEFVPPDGKAAWVVKQCWINTGYRLHIIAEAITAAIDWGGQAVEWILRFGVIYCTLALMCFANMLDCIWIMGLIRSCDGNITGKTIIEPRYILWFYSILKYGSRATWIIFCLNSHSDGTHSLQRIHWWASDVMLHFSKSVQMKKLTDIYLGWLEGE